MEDIAAVSTIVPDIQISFSDCRDPDDVIYLSAADVAKANFIVSADKDLLVLKRFREVDIISSADFIYLLKQIIG